MEYIKLNFRKFLYSFVFSFLFVIFWAFGDALNKYDTIFINYFYFNFLKYFFFFSGITVLGYFLLDNLNKIQNKLENLKFFPLLNNIFFSTNKKSFLFCFLFIFCFHIPSFLALFPGIWTYDVFFQLHFFINHDFIEIHPFLHNLIIYVSWLIQKNYPHLFSGIFLYTFFQVFLMIGIYTYYIHILSKYKFPNIIKFLSLLFFAFYPTNQIFLLIATKDVLFVGFVILTILLMMDLFYDNDFFKNIKKPSFLILIITFMFLFRHNAFYSYIFCLPFYFYFFFYKKNYIFSKKLLLIFFIPIIFYTCANITKMIFGIKLPSIASSVSIPLQQMGRVRVLHDKELSFQDKEDWKNIVSKDNELKYNKFSVDFLKFDKEPIHLQHSYFLDNSIKTNPKRFFSLWYKWGKLYPQDYINSFLFNNYKYWYIGAVYTPRYPGNYLVVNGYNNLFNVDIPKKKFIPFLNTFYYKLFEENNFQSNWISFVSYSIAWNSWILFALFIILLYQKRYNFLIILLIIPSLFLGVLFGPTVVFRYIYQNYLILPLLFSFCFSSDYICKKGNFI